MPETVLHMSANCPPGVLSDHAQNCDNKAMEEMMKELKRLGLPADERRRIEAYYRGDPAGLRDYLLYMRALFDDRHEYVS